MYRLWDVSTGKCFNSFHVTFIEHLDALPSSLLPGTTVELLPGSPPSWDSPSINLPPVACTSIPVAPSLPPISPASPLSASIPSPHAPSSLPSTLPPPNVVFPDSNTTIQITLHPSNTVGRNDQNNLPVVTLDTTNTDRQITNTDRQLIVHPLDTVVDPLLAPSTLLPATLTPSADDPPPPDPSPPADPPLLPPGYAGELPQLGDRCDCAPEWRCDPHDACFIHDSCFCDSSGSWPPVKPVHSRWHHFSSDWKAAMESRSHSLPSP